MTPRLDELPTALRRLRPREIEDVLCIYKDVMPTGQAPSVTTQRRA